MTKLGRRTLRRAANSTQQTACQTIQASERTAKSWQFDAFFYKLLIFKRPQLAIKLQALMQPATSAAAKAWASCDCVSSVAKPTFTTKRLRHNLNRPQFHQQSAHNRLGTSAGKSKRQGLSGCTAATSATSAPVLVSNLLPSCLALRQLGTQQQGGTQASLGSDLRPWWPIGQSWLGSHHS